MAKFITVKYPYCQHDNKVNVQGVIVGPDNPILISCDLDDGGCDKPFLVTVKLLYVASTFSIDLKDEVRHG